MIGGSAPHEREQTNVNRQTDPKSILSSADLYSDGTVAISLVKNLRVCVCMRERVHGRMQLSCDGTRISARPC